MKWALAILSMVLAVVVVVPFAQVRDFEFVGMDDEPYVTKNPYVRNGLSAHTVRWAFTEIYSAHWHPLTWLSLAIDCQLFGVDSGALHLVNLAIHTVSTVLLFVVLTMATSCTWPSFLVALLFGVHPLHVESVAWVSERKDVLSGVFWIAAMGFYVAYARARGKRRSIALYTATAASLVLSLLSKPMAVTLPFVFVMMDVWPLGRASELVSGVGCRVSCVRKLVLEKIPLFLVVGVMSFVAYRAQAEEAVVGMDLLGIGPRIVNAILSYAAYISKAVWPARLAVFYPYTADVEVPHVKLVLSSLLLVAGTFLAVRGRRRHPWLLFGWLWYLGTLVPVIGFVQIGGQAMADRYTYLPLIGIFVAAAFESDSALRPHAGRACRTARSALTVLLVLILVPLTYRQASHWRNSKALFSHALAVTTDNYRAHYAFGLALDREGRPEQALKHYRRTLELLPHHVRSYNAIGVIYARDGQLDLAAQYYRKGLRYDSKNPELLYNYGNVFLQQGAPETAEELYRRSIDSYFEDADAHYLLGIALARQGRVSEAEKEFEVAVRLDPTHGEARRNLDKARSILEEQ